MLLKSSFLSVRILMERVLHFSARTETVEASGQHDPTNTSSYPRGSDSSPPTDSHRRPNHWQSGACSGGHHWCQTSTTPSPGHSNNTWLTTTYAAEAAAADTLAWLALSPALPPGFLSYCLSKTYS